MISFLREASEFGDGDSLPFVIELPKIVCGVVDETTIPSTQDPPPRQLQRFRELAMLQRALTRCVLNDKSPHEND